ncbi:endonuclease/exonuclease/phosphatase family protein [Pseudoxanthobacter sp. M-2]|uniref:endonuclease/exonuclease/phosphatase family protein n=1 Tax=Pseudoxanthobacter sp. M-2 TaxID=3078754 RepID=UPI0038FD15D8
MASTLTGRPPVDQIRCMTWNVHRGIGPDGRYDFQRVVALIERHAPDVLALQELDTRGIQDLEKQPLSILSRAFGLHAVEARTIVAPDGHYGHALLCRWPILADERLDLTVRSREPRCAIGGLVETPLGRLHVRAIHFGLDPFERREQVRRVCASSPPGEAAVLLGDFNDWLGVGFVRSQLRTTYGAAAARPTFPAGLPLLSLDRIYARPPLTVARTWTDAEARHASDHLPLIADLALQGG